MVDRNHVFSLRNTLKLGSASADDIGTTISNLTRASTCKMCSVSFGFQADLDKGDCRQHALYCLSVFLERRIQNL